MSPTEMPVINFSFGDLKSLMGKEIEFETLIERLPMMGADIHTAEKGSDELAFEFFPDRPDLYSVEGIARAFGAFLGINSGLRRYEVSESEVVLNVDPSVETVRPFIWSALVTGVEMNDYLIRSVMDIQEKLHLTVGRNRRKVAIGIHDFDTVNPPFLYTTSKPEEMSFFPLQGTREMTLREILEDHDKGRAYAFVLEGKERYPIILDRDQNILSFPPIINGIVTTVTEETKNIFVDCTGTDLNALKVTVNILVTALAERGAQIHSVRVTRGSESVLAPDLEPWRISVPLDMVRELTGIAESPGMLIELLARMGYSAVEDGQSLSVDVPAYRYDILHPADVIEDIAKAYGYERFGKRLPRYSTLGVSDRELDFWEVLRNAMIGLGFLEVSTLTLTGREDQYARTRRPEPEQLVEVLNPRSNDHSILRTSLLPELMSILRKNTHRDLPQRVFEVGEVVENLRNHGSLAGVSIHAKASFTEVKSIVEGLLRSVGIRLKIAPAEDPSFVRGRCASVLIDGDASGLFGEVHPEVISSFDLGYPVAAFELRILPIMNGTNDSWSR